MRDAPAPSSVALDTIDNPSQQYLTFRLGHELFGFSVLSVQEIVTMTAITRVPQMPDFFLGVINLRGRIIPTMCPRIRFGLPAAKPEEKACIIIAQLEQDYQSMFLGLLVDEVLDVLRLSPEKLEDGADLTSTAKSRLVDGIAHTESGMVVMLNVENLLSDDEMPSVRELAGPGEGAES